MKSFDLVSILICLGVPVVGLLFATFPLGQALPWAIAFGIGIFLIVTHKHD